MSRFAPYLYITAALLLGVFIYSFSSVVYSPIMPVVTENASSTVAVESNFDMPQLTVPDLVSDNAPATSSAQQAPPVKKAKSPPTISSPTVPVTTAPPPSPEPIVQVATINAEMDASASLLRAALVNIVCYMPSGSRLRSILGTGVFIDAKGIILTNAHIAQYFLLIDRGADCTIRSGSPASDKYDAELIYISPEWLRANASVVTQSNPSGTGEYDFALIAVTKSATSWPLPSTFPYIQLATKPSQINTPVVIASYGAQFLESNQIRNDLFPTIVFGSVKDVFTFAVKTIDVIALGGSAAAQEGSSGGGVSDASGKLVGTITTSTVEGETSKRKLNAITASYIRSAYASETGSALDLLLDKPTATSIADFAPKMPALEAILTSHLQ